jgi:hypothetical protein
MRLGGARVQIQKWITIRADSKHDWSLSMLMVGIKASYSDCEFNLAGV